MNNLYTMADCTTGFEYILKRDDDPKQIAMNLLKQIEEKEGCQGLNKYEMALTIVGNDQRKMITIDADANTMRKLKMVSHAIVSEQATEEADKEYAKRHKENLEFARKYKQGPSVHSSTVPDDSSTQPQTGKTGMSEEERQKKIEEDRKKRLADYEAAQAAKKNKPKKSTLRSIFGFGGNKTKKSKKGMSMCVKKTTKKCEKVRGCKVASGKKRTYCRKKKNHTKKSHKK